MLEQFKQLPKAMQALMGVLAAAAAIAFAALIDPRAVTVLFIGVVIIILALVVWYWFQRRKARKRARALSGQISANTGAAPNAPVAVSKPNPWYPDHAVFSATKDQLKAMPQFKYST